MARFRSALALICAAALPLALGGCAGVLVVGGLAAAGGAGYTAAQERGVGGLANNVTIKTNIETAFIKADPRLPTGITTNVYGGRVLLTGQVPNQQMKAAANQIASRTQGVRGVYDELQVASTEGVWDGTKDAWITAQVRSKMVVDPAIRSVNYTIDTENGSVYLIGSARSQDELERTTRIARYVPGVKRVVSYVELRSGAPVAAIQAPRPEMSAPANAGSAPSGVAPIAPIEVQKL